MATQGGKYQRKPTDQKKRAICDDSLIIVELKIRHFLAAFLDILLKTAATFSHLSCYFPVVPCLEKFCGTSICSLYFFTFTGTRLLLAVVSMWDHSLLHGAFEVRKIVEQGNQESPTVPRTSRHIC